MMPVTSGAGNRVYCQLLEEELPAEGNRRRDGGVRMLSKSISSLLEEIESDNCAAALRESVRSSEADHRQQVSILPALNLYKCMIMRGKCKR